MALLVNMRQLEKGPVHLEGELSVAVLDVGKLDELITMNQPLKYDLTVEKLEDGILAQGRLELTLDCECGRCLKAFEYQLELESWACHLALEGEEKVEIVNDCVDLTPAIREDILLEFPQHPLCEPECAGLPKKAAGKKKNTSSAGQTKGASSAWTELNKLKF